LTSRADLSDAYRGYIDCLNAQDWPNLGRFVHEDVHYNGTRVGLAGYRRMLERDYLQIPDLRFDIELLISDPPWIAARLAFDCTPKAMFLGIPVNGRKVSFTENVFYGFKDGKIENVRSIIDKAAIEARISGPG
jgi:predicted ester cyclase